MRSSSRFLTTASILGLLAGPAGAEGSAGAAGSPAGSDREMVSGHNSTRFP